MGTARFLDGNVATLFWDANLGWVQVVDAANGHVSYDSATISHLSDRTLLVSCLWSDGSASVSAMSERQELNPVRAIATVERTENSYRVLITS